MNTTQPTNSTIFHIYGNDDNRGGRRGVIVQRNSSERSDRPAALLHPRHPEEGYCYDVPPLSSPAYISFSLLPILPCHPSLSPFPFLPFKYGFYTLNNFPILFCRSWVLVHFSEKENIFSVMCSVVTREWKWCIEFVMDLEVARKVARRKRENWGFIRSASVFDSSMRFKSRRRSSGGV